MSLLFMNGFGHKFPQAQHFGFDEVVGTFWSYDTQDAEDMLRVRVNGPDPDRGGHAKMAHDGDLWIGGRFRPGTHFADRGPVRMLWLVIDGSRAVQIAYQGANQGAGGLNGNAVGIYDGTEDNIDLTSATLLAASAGSAISQETNQWFRVHVQRGTSDGTVTVYIDGTEVVSASGIAALATEQGDVTDVVFTGRSTGTGTNVEHVWFGHLWIDTTTSHGAAEVVTIVPTTQGFHDDGVASTGEDKPALVNNIPPNTGEYVSLNDPADRESYVYDGAPVAGADGVFVQAVQIRPLLDTGVDITTFVREDGTDADAATIASAGEGLRKYGAILETDPHTSGAWSKAKLGDGAEFGYTIAD